MSVEDELKLYLSDPFVQTIEDVVVAGGYMTPELLVLAYRNGIFPWPHEGYPLLWFAPEKRGVLDFSELHLSKSFTKWLKKNRSNYNITINQNFTEVVRQCRLLKRNNQSGTWINDEIEKNYAQLSQIGAALSVEVNRGGVLVGGIYGVKSNNYFSAESMFHLEDNTSKLAFIELVAHLKSLGLVWMDLQMVSDVSASFGAKLISKKQFLKRIL